MNVREFIKSMVLNGSIKEFRIYEKGEIEKNRFFLTFKLDSQSFSKIDFIRNFGERKVEYWEVRQEQIFDFNNDCELVLILNVFIGVKNEK